MSDLKAQVAQQLGEAQSKYTYFLLAVSVSCIALAIQRTTGSPLRWHQIPLGLAVLSWGGSFWAGCKNRAFVSSTLYANVAFLQLEDGSHPEQPQHSALVRAAMEGVMSAANTNSASGNRWGHWQFRLLVAGASLFVVWHILQMAITAVPIK